MMAKAGTSRSCHPLAQVRQRVTVEAPRALPVDAAHTNNWISLWSEPALVRQHSQEPAGMGFRLQKAPALLDIAADEQSAAREPMQITPARPGPSFAEAIVDAGTQFLTELQREVDQAKIGMDLADERTIEAARALAKSESLLAETERKNLALREESGSAASSTASSSSFPNVLLEASARFMSDVQRDVQKAKVNMKLADEQELEAERLFQNAQEQLMLARTKAARGSVEAAQANTTFDDLIEPGSNFSLNVLHECGAESGLENNGKSPFMCR